MKECESVTVLPYVLGYIIRPTTSNNKSIQEVLLSFRLHTNFGNDHYGLIGGKIEKNESPIQALFREVEEEIGIKVAIEDTDLRHTIYFQGQTCTCMSFVFIIKKWQGEPFNREPDKHDHIRWFDIDALPSNILPRHRRIIEHIKHNVIYSDEGFAP